MPFGGTDTLLFAAGVIGVTAALTLQKRRRGPDASDAMPAARSSQTEGASAAPSGGPSSAGRANDPSTDPEVVVRVMLAAEWEALTASEESAAAGYAGAAIDREHGYIHLSTPAQAEKTARLYFAGREDLLLMSVDAAALGAGLRYEPPPAGAERHGDLFPHYHGGPLPLSSVLAVNRLPLSPGSRVHEFPTLPDTAVAGTDTVALPPIGDAAASASGSASELRPRAPASMRGSRVGANFTVTFGPGRSLRACGEGVLTPTQVLRRPTISFDGEHGALYTIALIDPDAPSTTDRKFACWVHWLVVNVPGAGLGGVADLDEADTLVAYSPSGPAKGSGLHRYTLALYRQERGRVPPSSAGAPSISATSGFAPRRCFDVALFAARHGMPPQPEGVCVYLAGYDDAVPGIAARLTGTA